MSRARTVDRFMRAPTHSHPEGRTCEVMTECAIHTVTLPEGSFSAVVLSRPDRGVDVIAILDHDEVEEHIRLMLNAVEDAKRIDVGQQPVDRSVHAAAEFTDAQTGALGRMLDHLTDDVRCAAMSRDTALRAMRLAYDSGRFGLSVMVAEAARQLRDHQQQANEDGSMVTVSREAIDVIINHLAIDGETSR